MLFNVCTFHHPCPGASKERVDLGLLPLRARAPVRQTGHRQRPRTRAN